MARNKIVQVLLMFLDVELCLGITELMQTLSGRTVSARLMKQPTCVALKLNIYHAVGMAATVFCCHRRKAYKRHLLDCNKHSGKKKKERELDLSQYITAAKYSIDKIL